MLLNRTKGTILAFTLLASTAAFAQSDSPNTTPTTVKTASSQASTVIKQLKQAAHSGNAEAQRQLAIRYQSGDGVTKDLHKAYELFASAARQSDPQAQFYLGQAYLKGLGTDSNTISAYIWLSLSAEQSSPVEAQAKALRDEASQALNSTQRDKGKLLVDQLKQLYLAH